MQSDYLKTTYLDQMSKKILEEHDYFKYCLEDAKEATTSDLPMYIDENGILKIYIPFPSVAGTNWYYQLIDFQNREGALQIMNYHIITCRTPFCWF